MDNKKERIEPVLPGNSGDKKNAEQPTLADPPRLEDEKPPIRWSIVLLIVLISLLVSDRLWERYQVYRAQQALEQFAAEAEQGLLNAQRQMQRSLQETQAQQAARRQQQRQARAESNQGRWLAKNCSDWRRADEQLPTATTAQETRRHCAIYERYLETGRH